MESVQHEPRKERVAPSEAPDDTAEGIRSLEAERRDPGPDLRASGGMGANPTQAQKGRADDRALREAGVQSGTQRDPIFPEEDE
ncbi:hypothetical protein [Novosphingobium resinovorum]|uniref:Uncharacterized protein n=1 Tax=Novosphingobium resinovorum TaxID=158500 RepID=A0A031JGG6_9SPHN|nr:hypothetical protein [Novosphingobium resinovorum]EZP71820.1 hypothetical protein BV97_05182 [Novosphingobium resinovorum]